MTLLQWSISCAVIYYIYACISDGTKLVKYFHDVVSLRKPTWNFSSFSMPTVRNWYAMRIIRISINGTGRYFTSREKDVFAHMGIKVREIEWKYDLFRRNNKKCRLSNGDHYFWSWCIKEYSSGYFLLSPSGKKMSAMLAAIFMNENDRTPIRFHWNWFPGVQLKISQHWFR